MILIIILSIIFFIVILFIIPENKLSNTVKLYVNSTKSKLRESTSTNKCEKIRAKHSDWFDHPNQVRWTKLDFKRLGILNENNALTTNATEENLYDIGYMWMCGLRNHKSNRKELYDEDWTYGDDGYLFLGYPASDPNKQTILAKAYNRGYNDAQNDRNIPK